MFDRALRGRDLRLKAKYLPDMFHRALRGRDRLTLKEFGELDWWRHELERYCAWYEGKISLYDMPAPSTQERLTTNTMRAALLAAGKQTIPDRYPNDLMVPNDYFRGRRVLEVGCGPIPYCLAFTGCEISGLDPLIEEYRWLAMPLGEYPGSERLDYVKAYAEDIPFPDGSFNAVFAVNAIDHVDDLATAAREIARVLLPDGELRMQVHYHPQRLLEPWSLDDETIRRHFGHLGLRKVDETPVQHTVSGSDETLVVWSNSG